jgi:hypothetical protein
MRLPRPALDAYLARYASEEQFNENFQNFLASQAAGRGLNKQDRADVARHGAVILGCVGYAVVGGLDEKSRFIFLQIPIVLQSALAAKLGLAEILQNVNWVTAYLIFAGPVFILLYFMGSCVTQHGEWPMLNSANRPSAFTLKNMRCSAQLRPLGYSTAGVFLISSQ